MAQSPSSPDLGAVRAALESAQEIVDGAARHLAKGPGIDHDQTVAYDLAHAAAGVEVARFFLTYGEHGAPGNTAQKDAGIEAALAAGFASDVLADLAGKLVGREPEWGTKSGVLDEALAKVAPYRDPRWLADHAGKAGPRHLEGEFEMVADTFRRFGDEKIAPKAEHIHRHNTDIPEDIISGLGELGAFGLSIPEEYGGYAGGGESDYLGMVIATEELSRASLGAGGSLITRPEILARALVRGGTDEQKHHWLPKLASGEIMAAVSVTEPDFGSDVANLICGASKAKDGSGDWVIDGTKTWCTFAARADVLMLLVRTDPDRSKGHKGLSLFVVPKERTEGHGFVLTQPHGGRLEGRPIDTIGYRGMHSYELSFSDWRVPHSNLVGGEGGLGRGFYYQMEGFENGRLQTAARAVGVMQAAYEAAVAYAEDRKVFGKPVGDYQLTQVKLTKMAFLIQAARQYMYEVGRLMAKGEGALEASMVKAYVCRSAEWVTREALQIHGGMGYAEEYPVSRYFVDARVLSIFEGADETLALKVIARQLVKKAGA